MERESIEVSAKSVEEAVAKGLAQLGVRREEAEIQVLSEGKRGLLGWGGEEARVLISVSRLPEEEVGQMAKEALERLLALMGVKAQVSIRGGDEQAGFAEALPIVLDITGDDLGILIGRRGDTLSALQSITRLIVSRKIRRWANVVVDVERYKVRRERFLKQLAQRMAERVQLTRQPVALEPMPAHERRIVHLALRDHPAVTTQSVGEGDSRRVTIRPKA